MKAKSKNLKSGIHPIILLPSVSSIIVGMRARAISDTLHLITNQNSCILNRKKSEYNREGSEIKPVKHRESSMSNKNDIIHDEK